MTIHLYDGMAVLRRRFDTDIMGNAPRAVFNEMLALPANDIAIWCFEGKGSKAERQKLFPGYKDRPSTMTSGIFALIDLVRKAMQHTKALQVAVPRREADDVIGHLCHQYGPTGRPIIVHTIDRDLKALETWPNVKVDCGDVMVKPVAGDRSFDKKVKAPFVRLYKTLVGDNSDKIPGMKGFGDAAYAACDELLLLEAVLHLVDGRPDAQRFVKAGVKLAMAGRMAAPENAALIHTFWTIVGFLPMPDDWATNITVGTPNRAAGTLILQEFNH